jgi:signal recognition particle receptor subunit beta
MRHTSTGYRIDNARAELHDFIRDFVDCTPTSKQLFVLVLANKQDLPGALGAAEVAERLEVSKLRCVAHVQPCSAITMHGMGDGFDWLAAQLSGAGVCAPLVP